MSDKIIERVARPGAPSALKAFILSAWPDLSGNRVNGLLHRGQVKLRGEVTTQFDAPVNEGDAVAINFTRPYTVLRHPRLQLVYEDEYVVVVNKGYGLLSVSRGAAKPETTAYNIVKNYLKECDSRQKVFIVHRLDRDTSGLMMFAKTPEAKEAMQHNWNNMVLERKYVAVVEGNVENDEGVIRSYLGETSAHEVFSTQDPQQGKLAVTRYKVLARGQGRSLVEYSLDTGRKNQIRVHSRELGHPIVGDRRYGASQSPIGRLCLHARTLRFVHPQSRNDMNFQLPVPAKFLKLVGK
ncbi:MAG: RNA pseudouridine synthase [Prevotella sp.]|nr:RNA pseudouridine synthase [Prevotella sp.]